MKPHAKQHSLVNLKAVFMLVATLLILGGLQRCEKADPLNTNKNTYYDDIADITYLNGSFFTTNYDLSGNAGSQIDLFKFQDFSGTISVVDNYDLDMNGQGYLAICNDGRDLYLQARDTELLIKSSVLGETAFMGYDSVASNWHPSGVAYDADADSLCLLYRNSSAPDNYRMRVVDKDLAGPASRDLIFSLPFIDQGYFGIYALEYHDSTFFMLGVDTSHVDVLVMGDRSLTQFQQESISDSTVVGLAFKEHDLYLSYRDRRMEYWSSY